MHASARPERQLRPRRLLRRLGADGSVVLLPKGGRIRLEESAGGGGGRGMRLAWCDMYTGSERGLRGRPRA